MTIAKIHYTSLFVRNLKNLSKEKQKQAIKKEKLFKQNPFAPSLKTHKLAGRLEGYWAFSITHQDRVVFRFINKNEVLFYRIGSHAIYKN
ncbi:MAG: type II toxin-antitoxin system mRNA interferase toxin, RelE/StbE family [Candidatus Levybacteria bacterium]|nr:type II toxin-antitoxin system mRNA interferase toxin, RelE/StbE family [Candidatus Levybacteria bacterium]